MPQCGVVAAKQRLLLLLLLRRTSALPSPAVPVPSISPGWRVTDVIGPRWKLSLFNRWARETYISLLELNTVRFQQFPQFTADVAEMADWRAELSAEFIR